MDFQSSFSPADDPLADHEWGIRIFSVGKPNYVQFNYDGGPYSGSVALPMTGSPWLDLPDTYNIPGAIQVKFNSFLGHTESTGWILKWDHIASTLSITSAPTPRCVIAVWETLEGMESNAHCLCGSFPCFAGSTICVRARASATWKTVFARALDKWRVSAVDTRCKEVEHLLSRALANSTLNVLVLF